MEELDFLQEQQIQMASIRKQPQGNNYLMLDYRLTGLLLEKRPVNILKEC
jgi:hypothetical protein